MPRSPSFPKRLRGLSLVELVVVVVLVGLDLTIVVRGAELLSSGKTKQVAREIEAFRFGYLTYLDRYRALPGDDAAASAKWAAARDGTGDWNLSGRYDDPPPPDPAGFQVDASTGQSPNFWWHLRLAGLLDGGDGNPAARPAHAFGERVGVQNAGGNGNGNAGNNGAGPP